MERDYSINIPHFYSLEYREGDKRMAIELDFRDKTLYLEPDLVTKWDMPFNELVISHEEKIRILNNIREYLLEKWRPEEVIIIES